MFQCRRCEDGRQCYLCGLFVTCPTWALSVSMDWASRCNTYIIAYLLVFMPVSNDTMGIPITENQLVRIMHISLLEIPRVPSCLRYIVHVFHARWAQKHLWRPATVNSFYWIQANCNQLRAVKVWKRHMKWRDVSFRLSMQPEILGAQAKSSWSPIIGSAK